MNSSIVVINNDLNDEENSDKKKKKLPTILSTTSPTSSSSFNCQISSSSVFLIQALICWFFLCMPGNLVTLVLYFKPNENLMLSNSTFSNSRNISNEWSIRETTATTELEAQDEAEDDIAIKGLHEKVCCCCWLDYDLLFPSIQLSS